MNLQKLFEIQAKLDAHIEQEHPRQPSEDRLAKKILALQVELGELANEWRGFKYWSHDQEPRIKSICTFCKGQGFTDHLEDWLDSESHYTKECEFCDGTGYEKDKNPLLEEYVDCLHFILSIGLDLKTTNIVIDSDYTGINETETFIIAFETTVELANAIREGNKSYIYQVYEELFNLFVGLGEKYLGFTWDEIEQAYLEKNRINHERQLSNY